jgi:hypothetical protein
MSLSGATLCITGTLSMLRKDFESMLRQHGAHVVPSLTKSCTHLVCNDDKGSSKTKKALARGLCILSESAVLAMIAAPEQQAQQNEEMGKEPASKKVKVNTIADGESVLVPGKAYVMKNIGGIYSCTCSGWKFQSKKIDARTCKHLQEYCGTVAEQKRLKTVTEGSAAAASKKQQKASSTKGSGGLFEASNLILAHAWNFDKHNPTDYGESNGISTMLQYYCTLISLLCLSAFYSVIQFGLKSLTECGPCGMATSWSRASAIQSMPPTFSSLAFLLTCVWMGNCLQDERSSNKQYRLPVAKMVENSGGT